MSLKDGDQPGEQVRSCVTYAAPDKHSYWNGNRLECFFPNIFELVQNCHLCFFLSALSTLLPPEVVLLPILSNTKDTHTHKAHMCSSRDKHAHKHKHKHKAYLRRVSARSSDSLRLSGLLRSKEVSYLSRQYYQQPVNRQADWKYFH